MSSDTFYKQRLHDLHLALSDLALERERLNLKLQEERMLDATDQRRLTWLDREIQLICMRIGRIRHLMAVEADRATSRRRAA